jgi:predicted ester cyclase
MSGAISAQIDCAAVIERYVGEVLSGDGPATLDGLVSNAVLRQRVSAFRSAFPDLRVTTKKLACQGDLIAVHATATGTHLGMFQGVPPRGRRWTGTCTAMYRVVDGQIVDFWENWDVLAILEQLGGVKRTAGASA